MCAFCQHDWGNDFLLTFNSSLLTYHFFPSSPFDPSENRISLDLLPMAHHHGYQLGGIDDQPHRFPDAHHKAGHVSVGQGDGAALGNLVMKDGDDRSGRAQNISETGGDENRPLAPLIAVGRSHEALADELGGTHDICRVYRLVGAGEYHLFHVVFTGGGNHVLNALNIGIDRLAR